MLITGKKDFSPKFHFDCVVGDYSYQVDQYITRH